MKNLLQIFKKKRVPERVNPTVKEAPLDIQIALAEKELSMIKAEEDPSRYIEKALRIKELKNKLHEQI